MNTTTTTHTPRTYTTLDELTASIQSFFGDPSNSREQTIAGLERAKGKINLLLETLEDEDFTDQGCDPVCTSDTAPTSNEHTPKTLFHPMF